MVTTSYEDVDREAAMEADARRRQEYLIERLGTRLRSRLLEMCAFVPMQAVPDREGRAAPSPPSTLGGMRRSQEAELDPVGDHLAQAGVLRPRPVRPLQAVALRARHVTAVAHPDHAARGLERLALRGEDEVQDQALADREMARR